jgi:hypothetical protein
MIVAGHNFALTCERVASLRAERYQGGDWFMFDTRPGDRAPWDGGAVRRVRLDGWRQLWDARRLRIVTGRVRLLDGLPATASEWLVPYEEHTKPDRKGGYENSGAGKWVIEPTRLRSGVIVPVHRFVIQRPVLDDQGRQVGIARVPHAWEEPARLYDEIAFRVETGPDYARFFWHGKTVVDYRGDFGYPDGKPYPQFGVYAGENKRRIALRMRIDEVSQP